jgi:hypothetical protein
MVEDAPNVVLRNNSAVINAGQVNTIIGNSVAYGAYPQIETFKNQPTGSNTNTVVGISSMPTLATTTTTPTNNTSAGFISGPYPASSVSTDIQVRRNTCIGQQTLGNITSNTFDSTAVGFLAGFNCGGGDRQTFLGARAGSFTSNAGNGVMIGFEAGVGNNGFGNTIIGTLAGRGTGGGNENTFLGFDCGLESAGSNCLHLGNRVGYRVQGSNNILIGSNIQQNASPTVLNNAFQVGTPANATYMTGDMSANTFSMSGCAATLGNLTLNAADLQATSGGNAGLHLRINLNGTFYKIRLEQD